MRSELGKEPWIPGESEKPEEVDVSLDSSSAKLLYECERPKRADGLRVTWGSDVRSQELASSSAEDREAREDEGLGDFGGNIFSLMWFDKQRGTGMESLDQGQKWTGLRY